LRDSLKILLLWRSKWSSKWSGKWSFSLETHEKNKHIQTKHCCLSRQDASKLQGDTSEVQESTTELQHLKRQVEQARAKWLQHGVERTKAETAVAKLKREKVQLDEAHRGLHSQVQQLKR
jgi:hypothetical protein